MEFRRTAARLIWRLYVVITLFLGFFRNTSVALSCQCRLGVHTWITLLMICLFLGVYCFILWLLWHSLCILKSRVNLLLWVIGLTKMIWPFLSFNNVGFLLLNILMRLSSLNLLQAIRHELVNVILYFSLYFERWSFPLDLARPFLV